MSAYPIASVDELTQALLEQEDGACLCVERGASDDVAAALIAKASHLVRNGTPARIVCPDGVSAARYRAALASQHGLGGDAVAAARELGGDAVVTARELALEVMADPRVQSAVGRSARVLDENEHDVLMEDVKVSGLKPGRLREMLKFFYKSISDTADEDEGWLVTSEEQTVHAILIENLDVRRALLLCEAPSMAYRGLVEAGVEPGPLALLVDDYGSLSKASQRLIRHLATSGLVAVRSVCPAANAEEPYPHFDGFDELAASCDAAFALETGRRPAPRKNVVLDSPEAEFSFVARAVRERLAAGVAPGDVLVAVPNPTWGNQIKAALAERGVPAAFERDSAKVKGDPRIEGRYGEIKLATFLKLYLDPHDITALRSWLGFGDWLLRSDAFLELMAYARDHGCTVAEALASLRTVADADRATTVFGKFDAPLDELEELLAACSSIGRDEAVELFAAHGMPLAPSAVELLGSDAARADIGRLARFACAAPDRNRADDVVTIAPYRSCHGRTAAVTFVTGLVNGFLPALDAVDDKYTVDHRRVALAREQLLFIDLLQTASDETICSRFARDRLENASVLPMQTSRVCIKDGVRYAAVAPSEFAEASDEVLAVPEDAPRELETRVLYASTTL